MERHINQLKNQYYILNVVSSQKRGACCLPPAFGGREPFAPPENEELLNVGKLSNTEGQFKFLDNLLFM